MVWVEIFVVLASIVLGLRFGGIAIGLFGGLGLAILTLGLRLPMGSVPIDVILIIMSVSLSAATLQATGGMAFLVNYAERLMRKNPKHINFIAPMITWLMTIFAGNLCMLTADRTVIYDVIRGPALTYSKRLLVQGDLFPCFQIHQGSTSRLSADTIRILFISLIHNCIPECRIKYARLTVLTILSFISVILFCLWFRSTLYRCILHW